MDQMFSPLPGPASELAAESVTEPVADLVTEPGRRCPWADASVAMREYHDRVWGVPEHDERTLFELLTLEGAQAGLSWATVLSRREAYSRAFCGFDADLVANFDDDRLQELREDSGIIRNRLKIASVRQNALAIIALRQAGTSLAEYLWSWTSGARIVHLPQRMEQTPPFDDLAVRICKDLRKRGFHFVGPTIIYSWMQAAGVIDDHLVGCPAKRYDVAA